MRIQFIQNLIDKIRGKDKALAKIEELNNSIFNLNNIIFNLDGIILNLNKKIQEMVTNSFYSQFGEDRIISLALTILKNRGLISDISYLDIGGNRPKELSNTYYFYLRGCKGCVIEPNPTLYSKFIKIRPHDKVLNAGIYFGENMSETMPFYMFNEEIDGLSSFSKTSADEILKYNSSAKKYEILNIPVKNVNDVIDDNFEGIAPTFVSLDVEGIELEILKSFNFNKYRPCFFIVETADYTNDKFLGNKNSETTNFMITKNYVVYADTYVNTIYIDKVLLETMYKNSNLEEMRCV